MDRDEPIETDEEIRNDLWFKKNYLELINEYPNQWIAVSGERVVSSGSIKSSVEAEAKERSEGRIYSLYFVPPSDVMF